MFKKHPLLLPDTEIATDAECDEVLKAIYSCNRTLRYLNAHAIQAELQKVNIAYTIDKIIAATSILYSEKFIRTHPDPTQPDVIFWEITWEGIAFINSDTYVRRGKRWEIDNGIKKFTYYAGPITVIISVVAIVISYYALTKPDDSKYILLMPTQKWIKEVQKVDTVYIRDSDYKGSQIRPKH